MKTEKIMKLYVWEDVLCDWTCGVIFAFAIDVASARKIVLDNVTIGEKESVLFAMTSKKPKIYTKPYGLAVWGGG